ncbi:MAG: hypothetical protein ACRD2T_00525, partial [Thermoanaerobaculia bacterium]
VLGILLVSVFSITIETSAFIGDTETDYSVQGETHQALARMTEILRKSGWNQAGGVSYPRVLAGGKELEFRVLRDLDGNGFPFDAATGELEWGAKVYRIRLDGGNNLRVFDAAGPVWHLGRYVESVSFATHNEDSSLQIREIAVNIQTRKLTKRGEPLSFALAGSIDMRN